ncbi:MFS transporter [Candidatus Neptunochlamydia vexilliferae]|uniref:MFS transporter n=1 Tax=Candidatus Neptunichlamydia vexilliferae TaxID=1651774 RepID=UPI0018916004|nr:MFS transporter [Candidatus Neptunochlamydia vexilliferae]
MRRIFPVLVVLFLGYLGFSLALPLFPPLFLDTKHLFLPPETTTTMRRILLGLLFAMYPFGQFIGAPLLGKLSDKYGRKPVLLISLVLVIPAFIGSALSVLYVAPLFLYLSRFLSGLLEGNIVIAQAAIADINEDPKQKARHFGWLVSLSSTAFFFGPLIGGKLADSTLVSWFHYDTPFWCAAILTGIGFCLVFALFRETHTTPDQTLKISPRTWVQSFTEGFKLKKLRVIFSANLFAFIAMFFFFNFFSPYLVNRFGFGFSLLGEVNAYLSVPFIIAPFFFGLFAKWWTSRQAMRLGALCICISYLIFVIPPSPWALLITLLPIGFFLAMGFAFPALMVSDAVSKRFQGEALGTNQALQVFAEGFTALIGGFIFAWGNTFPIYFGAGAAVIAAAILFVKPPAAAPAS